MSQIPRLIFYAGQNNVRTELNKFGKVLEGKNQLEMLADADFVVTDKTAKDEGFWIAQATSSRNVPVLALDVAESGMLQSFKHPLLTRRSLEDAASFFTEKALPLTFYPTYFLCDAIDGAGKGTIAKAVKEWGINAARTIFDITHFSNTANHIPTWEEVKELTPNCNMLIFQEPSFSWLGGIIRNEIIRKDNPRKYSTLSTAMAYALDREFMFKRLIIPALKENVIVFSDRGRITSDVYQPVQAELFEKYDREFFLGYVRGLPGNQLEESCIPGMLLVPIISAAITEERRNRRAKDDNAIFEVSNFQEEIAKIYDSDRIKRQYALRGTRVIDVPMGELKTPDDTKNFVKNILFRYEEDFWSANPKVADRGI